MYAAVDIGGTKTLVAVFTDDGNIKQEVKFPTQADYETFLVDFAKAVKDVEIDEVQAACVAVPGKIDRRRGVALAFGNLGWKNVPIQADIEKVFNAPVLIENDAKLAALSEALLVKDQYRKVLYLTISTGIGGGLIIDGVIDPNFEDMEVGQILLEHEGKRLIWEDFASGRAFAEKFGKKVSEVAEDDQDAWYYLAHGLVIGIIDLVATLSPEVIIIGGGAGSHLEKFQNQLQEQLKAYENPMISIPPILKAKRPEEAVVYGCLDLLKGVHAKDR